MRQICTSSKAEGPPVQLSPDENERWRRQADKVLRRLDWTLVIIASQLILAAANISNFDRREPFFMSNPLSHCRECRLRR
jgi:hypothetical protein